LLKRGLDGRETCGAGGTSRTGGGHGALPECDDNVASDCYKSIILPRSAAISVRGL
jgi:hypothetical protein